ncbi:hypothetical protein IFM89_009986 [Coptis chinensis]|uniref:Uncharacterized protein n=1 Tax=Coptis chinensis TaxID=261450 RepID=A0A835GX18_9MAGN|nr:hypothetical protein IFM89_009986 [Coptis chinensis]
MRILVDTDLQRGLKGIIPQDLVDKLSTLRSQISLLAEDTVDLAYTQLNGALERYLPVVLGLTKKVYSIEDKVEFRWKNLQDTQQDAIDLLIKAAGYLEFYFRDILICLPPDIKNISKSGQGSYLNRVHDSLLKRVLKGENYLKLYSYHYLNNGFVVLVTTLQLSLDVGYVLHGLTNTLDALESVKAEIHGPLGWKAKCAQLEKERYDTRNMTLNHHQDLQRAEQTHKDCGWRHLTAGESEGGR